MTTRILVTGMSGTGKSSVLRELEQRGYRVVDTDDPGWCVDGRWDEARMTELLAGGGGTLFVSGCVDNQGRFYDRFDAVVLLSAPTDVLLGRIASRTTNPYGRRPAERAEILENLRVVEPLLRVTCTHELDATRPLTALADDLESLAVGTTSS